ncbi:MAG: glycosyltransferase family 9 protein, partial [Calditrichaeota bacterium]|nr:glycosyltransferase family 9 protein [Calditrichota bacterium]
GPDERDICAEILAATGADCTENIAGELSLSETFGAISQTPLFISNDSGLMHAAAAFAVPQIAIFGSTTRELGFFPINPNAAIVENSGLNCRPCSHIGKAACPKGHFRCMREISPEMVLESVAQLAGVSSKTKK